MITKKQLFDTEETNGQLLQDQAQFSKNEKFIKKFEKREKHRLMQKGKLMEQEADEDSSEYSDEDSEGVLINDKVEKKFMETIARIRANDPSLKESKEDLFNDEDFDLEKLAKKEKEAKPLTIKSALVDKMKQRFGKYADAPLDEENLDAADESEDEVEMANNAPIKETDVAMQKRLKNEFLKAADDDDASDSDILLKKEKTTAEIEKERKEFEKLAEKEHQKQIDADKVLAQFWGSNAEARLDPEEKFLRSYILGEKWKEAADDYDDIADEEDNERNSEIDEFEHNYNFRFEEPGADQIKTYPRTIEGTYRIARNKRMQKKIDKQKRMKEFKEEKKKEFDQIRAIKRKDILEKLEKAKFFIGNPKLAQKIAKELETEFDPDMYDNIMANTFDDKYYGVKEKKSEVDQIREADEEQLAAEVEPKQAKTTTEVDEPEELEDYEMEAEEDQHEQQGDNFEQPTEQVPKRSSKQEKNDQEEDKDEEYEEDIIEDGQKLDVWYSCDGCYKVIKPGKFRFDCALCDNFTFCKKCFKNNDSHLHTFKKKKVPMKYTPPENVKDMIAEAYILCAMCNRSLLDKSARVLKCYICNCFLCKDCKDEHNNLEGEHNIKKAKDLEHPEQDDEAEKQKKIKEIEDILDDYNRTSFTDIIGKKIYTRFKYKNVEALDFGLSPEEILLLTDDELNNLVKLKNYKTYRDDYDKVNVHKVMQLKKKLKARIEEEKKHIKEVMKANAKVQKEALLGVKMGARKERDRLVKKEKQRIKSLRKRGKLEELMDENEKQDINYKQQKTEEVEESGQTAGDEPKGVAKDRSHLYGL